MTKKLKLAEIVTDAGTQVRAGLNETTVADYAEALADGAKFPPVIVFHDGSRYIAADGFHRIHAAMRIGTTQIECDVRKGSKSDALKFALGCNAHHGLRRTNADKRRAVEIAVKEFGKLSDLALAGICAVNRELVADVRKAHLLDSSRSAIPPVPQTRIGRDGVERRLPPPPMQRRCEPHGPSANGTDATNAPHPASGHLLPSAEKERRAALPPPPSQILDGTGWPIPTQLIPLWQRADEVQEMLTALSRVKGALRTAQENKDKLFAEVNFSSALSQLDQAWTDIKTAKPFAVCPTCQGQLPDKCTLCKGRGLISEHRWNTCVTREDKEFRFKARGKS
jgi:uncharacterized ParB-like nuclease family protein